MEKTPLQMLIALLERKRDAHKMGDAVSRARRGVYVDAIVEARLLLPVEKQWAKEVWGGGKDYGMEDERSEGYAYKMKAPDFDKYFLKYENK